MTISIRHGTTARLCVHGHVVGRRHATPSPVLDWCGVARARSMWCAISGTTPTNAVVTPGGVVYDKALIVKAIEVRDCAEGAMGVRGATSCAWISWMDCACDGECVRARSLACSVCARGFEWITARGWMMRVGEGCVRRARAKARVRGLGRTLERARGEARGVNAQFNATRLTMCCA